MTRVLVSEHRAAKPIIKSMTGIFDLLDAGIGEINHSCFNFNMNYHFETLANKVIEHFAKHKDKTFLSGNNKPLSLLANRVSGLIISNDDDETFDAAAIKIKPDCFILSSSGKIDWVLDAKYKILNYESATKVFRGVQSKDVQQLISYWLHFFEETGSPPNLTLIYPELSPQRGPSCLRNIGKIELNHPSVKGEEIKINICMLDIEKSLNLLLSSDGLQLANQVEELSA
jgi:hypothetical protein